LPILQPDWHYSLEVPALSTTTVHIWRASLDQTVEQIHHYASVLSIDEQKRAARFRFERDRHRFIVSRGIVRSILGNYLNLPPAQIQFGYGDRGKPFLQVLEADLSFNLSHSQEWLVCAVAERCQVGIDVEFSRPLSDLEQLTRRFFAPQEHRTIMALPPEEQPTVFLQYWTAKEALLKAIGEGLVDLSSLELAITDGIPQIVRWQGQNRRDWQLQLFQVAPEGVGAIACDGLSQSNPYGLEFWQWQG
jgi:4'-phosphopantetheinyl transferase